MSWTLGEAGCAKDLKKHNNQGSWSFVWDSQSIFLKALMFVELVALATIRWRTYCCEFVAYAFG